MVLVARGRTPAALLEPLRSAVRAIDPEVTVFDLTTADRSIMSWAVPVYAAMTLTTSLGLIALAIATLGVYGVMAYLVSVRTREFGIRLALGAKPEQVIRVVLDDGLHLLLVGLLAGVLVTSLGERLLQSRIFGFMPNEISTWIGVLLSILAVGLLAAFVPARRGSRIDPNVALRHL